MLVGTSPSLIKKMANSSLADFGLQNLENESVKLLTRVPSHVFRDKSLLVQQVLIADGCGWRGFAAS